MSFSPEPNKVKRQGNKQAQWYNITDQNCQFEIALKKWACTYEKFEEKKYVLIKTKSLAFPSAPLIRKLHNFTAKTVPVCVKYTEISFSNYTDREKAPTLLNIQKMRSLITQIGYVLESHVVECSIAELYVQWFQKQLYLHSFYANDLTSEIFVKMLHNIVTTIYTIYPFSH